MPCQGVQVFISARHMIGVREYFSELSESGTDIEVVLGDDNIVRAARVGH